MLSNQTSQLFSTPRRKIGCAEHLQSRSHSQNYIASSSLLEISVERAKEHSSCHKVRHFFGFLFLFAIMRFFPFCKHPSVQFPYLVDFDRSFVALPNAEMQFSIQIPEFISAIWLHSFVLGFGSVKTICNMFIPDSTSPMLLQTGTSRCYFCLSWQA